MIKVFRLLVLVILTAFINVGIASADVVKNFFGYQVKNVNIRELSLEIQNAVESYKGEDKFIPLENVNNAYIYSDTNCSYFVRLYPANQNTNIYVVSNEKYDVDNNEMTQLLSQYGYKYDKLDDRAAMKEYKFDFFTLARKQELGNFYISPDLVKPLKTGMAKLNNKMAKRYAKALPENYELKPQGSMRILVLKYKEDPKPINFTLKFTDGSSYNVTF